MHSSNIHLKFVKEIKVVITDTAGKEHVIIMTPDQIIQRTKSVMYQTFSNAVGFEMERKVEEVCYENIPEHEIFDGVRAGDIDFREYVSVSESYNKNFYFYLKVKGESKRFEFNNREEAEEILKLGEGLLRYLRNKKNQR
jgi:hypothetical protein